MKKNTFVYGAGFVMAAILMTASGVAEAASLDAMAIKVHEWAPPVMVLVRKMASLGGIALFIYSILKLAQVEQGKVELKAVFFKMIAAAGLIALAPFIKSIEDTMGATNESANVLVGKYAAAGGGGSMCQAMSGIMLFIKLVGLIAFVRGLLILKAHGENKEGSVGRSLTHMIGGSAAMNIEWTAKMLAKTINSQKALEVLCLS